MTMQTRKTARALLFDPAGRLLLMRIRTPQSPGPDNPDNLPFWVTIGGRMEPGEDYPDTIRREIAEETGITTLLLDKPVWHGRQILNIDENPTIFDETFLVCHTPETAISTANLTKAEHDVLQQYRWWPLGELATTTELIFPPVLPHLIRSIAAGILPDQPVEIPLTRTQTTNETSDHAGLKNPDSI